NSDSESVTPQQADLSLVKTVDNPSPNVGDTVTFTLTVANAGPDTATGVTVADVIPAGYSYVAASISGGDANNDAAIPTLTWTINSLAAGASADLTFQAEVLGSGTYANTAQVMAADQFDPDSVPGNSNFGEDDQDTVTVVPNIADVSITKTVDDTAPNVGDTVTFTLTVANAGPVGATNIEVSDTIPDGFTYTAASISGGDANDDAAIPTLTWTINSLAAGVSTDLTFQAEVNASGDFTNVAAVTASDQYDPDPGNNTDSETAAPQQADLSLDKTVDNVNPIIGETVTFTVTIANDGSDAATGIGVNDVIPDGYSYVAGSIAGGDVQDDSAAPTLTWTINSLAAGASTDLTFQAEVLATGDYENVAQVMAADQFDPDSVPGNSVPGEDDEDAQGITLREAADLSLVKALDVTTPDVGDTVTFTVTVANAGPNATTNVSVEDVLPDGYSYVAGSIAGGDTRDDSAAPTFTWSINSLAAGASAELTLQAEVLATGDYLNVAQVMASDQYDPDSTPGNNDDTEDDQDSEDLIPQSADLSLTKTVNNPSPNVGKTVTFTVEVTNSGPDNATGVSVEDILPSGYTYVAGSIAGGDSRSDASAPTLTWTINNLASGASVELTFRAAVLSSGDYVNTAQVTASDQYDPDSTPGNGSAGEDDQDSASVTPQEADLSLDKKVDNANPNVGETITFTLTLANAGPSTATGISVRDVLPDGFTYVAGSMAGGSSRSDASAPALTWTVNSLASGSSVDLTFQATVRVAGDYVNIAQVMTSNQYDPDSTPGNDDGDQSEDDEDSAAVSNINLFDPPYGIKTVSDDGLPQLEWGLVWINSGNADSMRVRIADRIPEGTTYVKGSLAYEARGSSSTISCVYDPSDNMVVWEGTIAADPGARNETEAENEVVITFRTTVDPDFDEVENQAAAYWDRNGDGVLDDADDNIRNDTPVLSDDVSTTPALDLTVWRRESGDGGDGGTLPKTGVDNRTRLMAVMSLLTIALGLALMLAGVIFLASGRRREESTEPVIGWDSSKLPYDG
ncbi:MAG: DUF11 domain-containing protein, partial [Actinomycetota bacterium]